MTIAVSFCFFLVLMTVVGAVSSSRKHSKAEDYLTGGRTHGKFMIALSGAASATSGFIMIGAVGAGYSLGLMAVFIPLSWFLGDFVFWTLFPSKINRISRDSACTTVPELIGYIATGKRFSGIRTFLAVVTVIFIGVYAIGQFLAAGKAVNGVFDVSITAGIVLSAIVVVSYSARGGLQSSIPTQFMQAIIMLFTTVGMFVLALYVGGGPVAIVEKLQATAPTLLLIDGARGPILFFLFALGFATTAFTFDMGQPHLLVRIMATKSPEEAAKARWIYLAFMQLTWISMSLFGLVMAVLLPDIVDAEQALLVFAKTNLHPILVGAVLVGVFAAVVSTLDALLLVLSSSLGVDLLPKLYAKMTARYGSRYQIFVTIAVTAVTAIAAATVVGNSTVFDIIVFSASGLGVTIGCTLLISILRWQTSSTALVVSALCGVVVIVIWRFMGLNEFLMEALPGFATSLLVHQVYVKLVLKKAIR